MHNYHNPTYPSTLGGRALPRRVTLALAPGLRLILVAIVLIALALRLWGLAFGLPYIIQPDEPSVEMRALHMWLDGRLNPGYFVYPSLYYDLQALWASLAGHVVALSTPDVLRHPYAHLPTFYLYGRALTALLGTLTVFVTYLAGRELNARLGLLAALFLAVAPQHAQQSHYITVDAPTALFTILAAFFALRLLNCERPGLGDVVWPGIAAGLAAGTKYNAGMALALPLAAIVLKEGWTWRRRLGSGALATACCLLTFLVTTPYAILDHTLFLLQTHVVAQHYSSGHPGAEGNDNALWYLLYLASTGLLVSLTLLALAGIAVVALRYRRAGLVLLAFVLPYYALLCSTYVRFDRNLLPLLPFLALLAAVAVDTAIPYLALLLRNRTAALVALAGSAAIPAAYATARADTAITHSFTEQVAVAWADRHLPYGAALATENWEGRPFELSPRHYRITHLSTTVAAQSYRWLKAHGVRYVVTDSYTDGAYLREPGRYPLEVARYHELYRQARLIFRVIGDTAAHPGPTMSIYEVR